MLTANQAREKTQIKELNAVENAIEHAINNGWYEIYVWLPKDSREVVYIRELGYKVNLSSSAAKGNTVQYLISWR